MKFCKVKEQALSQLTKQSILQYIQSMDLSISNKLPREELLAQELGVSRITVRSALNELASEGIIFRKQGKGTFVNQQALGMNVVFNPIGDLRDVIANSGYELLKQREDDLRNCQSFEEILAITDKVSKQIFRLGLQIPVILTTQFQFKVTT